MLTPTPRCPRAGAVSVLATIGLATIGLAGVLTLTGCTSASSTATRSAAPTISAAPPASTPTPTPTPAFSADVSTPVALAHFDSVVENLLKTDPQPHGRDVIDALVAAGFDKKAMELTPDTTTIGRNVDSIEFSVLWQSKDCLVGSVGASGFGSSSAPVLSTGKCLVGTTRSIDW